MTLSTAGLISFADVQTEFGGANPIGLDEYYGKATGVQATGAISLSDFRGTSYAWSPNIVTATGYVSYTVIKTVTTEWTCGYQASNATTAKPPTTEARTAIGSITDSTFDDLSSAVVRTIARRSFSDNLGYVSGTNIITIVMVGAHAADAFDAIEIGGEKFYNLLIANRANGVADTRTTPYTGSMGVTTWNHNTYSQTGYESITTWTVGCFPTSPTTFIGDASNYTSMAPQFTWPFIQGTQSIRIYP